MRISVSSWATTNVDVERSLDAMLRIARNLSVKKWKGEKALEANCDLRANTIGLCHDRFVASD